MISSDNEDFIAGFFTSTALWLTFLLLRFLVNLVSDVEGNVDDVGAVKHIGELPERLLQKLRKYGTRGRWPWDRKDRSEASIDLNNKTSEHSQLSESSGDDNKSGLCIGNIFGLDVGGTLTKLVYFERVELSDRHNSMHNSFSAVQDRYDTNQSSVHKRSRSNEHLQESFNNKFDMNDNTTHLKMKSSPSRKVKKITSCLDLAHSFKHEAALKNFYNFARNSDNYGETGVKEKQLSFYSRELGGELHFIRFETRSMENALDLIKDNNLHVNIKRMGATGGGAHKYAQDWERIVGIQMNKHEELECMVVGMQFILSYVVGECYTFKPNVDQNESSKADEDKPRPINDNWWSRKIQRDSVIDKTTYPYLLVTIGTGVSILRIDGSRKYSRVSGSTIGGGTYWGLCRLLTSAEHFEDVLNLAKQGDPCKVDMMVGDIYGNNKEGLEKLGLPADIVASSFGKLVAKLDPASGLEESDLARALLLMITNNIGQVAYLNALLHKTPRIYFVGNFLRHNNLSERRLAYAIDYWSGGEMEALFLEHEGYFGSLGAFLLNQESQPRRDESAGGGLFQDFIDDAVAAKILENRFFRKFRLNSK